MQTTKLTIAILGVAFVVLKLCGVIDWSWWLVTMPFWLLPLLALLIMLGAFLYGIHLGLKKLKKTEQS